LQQDPRRVERDLDRRGDVAALGERVDGLRAHARRVEPAHEVLQEDADGPGTPGELGVVDPREPVEAVDERIFSGQKDRLEDA